jgi:hypothetical protein
MKNYPLLEVRVTTPGLELCGATDELLDELADLVRAGKTHADPAPYDDPMSFYETDPDLRIAKWLRAIWRRRGTVEPDLWRLHFVVVVDGRPETPGHHDAGTTSSSTTSRRATLSCR